MLHIGFLDFTLFPEYPEFVAEYQLMNITPQHRYSYSDKLHITVVNLKETSNAMYELDRDRLIRQQCQAREDSLYWERIKEHRNK